MRRRALELGVNLGVNLVVQEGVQDGVHTWVCTSFRSAFWSQVPQRRALELGVNLGVNLNLGAECKLGCKLGGTRRCPGWSLHLGLHLVLERRLVVDAAKACLGAGCKLGCKLECKLGCKPCTRVSRSRPPMLG
jgi:hypothetical protein